jgi:hypothetical protein
MLYRERRQQPLPWVEYKTKARHSFTVPFVAIDWVWEWVACFLSNWAFLEALEYLSSFGILVAVIFYFAEHGERTRQRHLQMWQVMNTAQGKGGSGGRIEALQELNTDHVPLVGVDVSGAFLGGVKLKKAELLRANFSAADVRDGDFTGADFRFADLRSANFRAGRFVGANLRDANCAEVDFTGADLSGADLAGADLSDADLRMVQLRAAQWSAIANIKGANIYGIKDAPEGFATWALKNGAVATEQ